jgi:cytochrome c oxidase subunit IV
MSAKHDQDDDGAVHAHISSAPFYIGIFICLLILTVLTVGQSYVDLGKLNLVTVIVIASMKASLVVTFFMHLRHDNRFNALMFVSGLLFIGVFFAYTMNDTDHRGQFDPLQNVRVNPADGKEAPGGRPPLEEHAAPAPGGAAPAPGGAAPAQHH